MAQQHLQQPQDPRSGMTNRPRSHRCPHHCGPPKQLVHCFANAFARQLYFPDCFPSRIRCQPLLRQELSTIAAQIRATPPATGGSSSVALSDSSAAACLANLCSQPRSCPLRRSPHLLRTSAMQQVPTPKPRWTADWATQPVLALQHLLMWMELVMATIGHQYPSWKTCQTADGELPHLHQEDPMAAHHALGPSAAMMPTWSSSSRW
mmetsp:Transcript_19097/g.44664  ORF Transcript_19097/g.44664 Transcript_19097/m.44664 type:complete len:207 (-) Transcript_19097:1358-1978(-)